MGQGDGDIEIKESQKEEACLSLSNLTFMELGSGHFTPLCFWFLGCKIGVITLQSLQ